MGLMNRRPSRFVVALARWALMAGLAGIVLALLAVVDRWRAPENLEARHNLLVISAVLLALSFVFAPFVRRAFGVVRSISRERPKTLLDELRERPEGERLEAATVAVPDHPPEPRSPIVRLILVLYIVFGATLVAVVFSMR